MIPRAFLTQGVLFANLLIIATFNLVIYVFQIADTNSYVGYQELVFDAQYVIRAAGSLVVLAALMPASIAKPSDFFCLFYGLFVVASYALFHAIGGEIYWLDYAAHFVILIFPLCIQRALGYVQVGFRVPGLLSARAVESLLLVLCVIGSLAMLIKRPDSAGFDLVTAYERRLEGRDIFAAGSLLGYLISMIANGFVPYLAFLGGNERRPLLLVSALVFVGALFYVLGLKAPFLYAGLAYLVGAGLRSSGGAGVYKVVLGSLWVLFVVFTVEVMFDQISLVAELFFRRVFISPADVVNTYFDLMFGRNRGLWSAVSGIDAPRGVTYLVGYLYSGNSEANANTSAFVYALCAGGVPGYLATVLLTVSVFSFFDSAFCGSGDHGFVFLGFEYALLLTEQGATTALVSSGIGVVGLLVLLRSTNTVGKHADIGVPCAGGREVRRQ